MRLRFLPLALLAGLLPALGARAASAQLCGNSAVEADEECDDGNDVGGDGCASNCTRESRYECELAPGSRQTIHVDAGAVASSLPGSIVITAGQARTGDPAGDVPVVVRLEDMDIAAAAVSGVGTSCLLRNPLSTAGEGNVGGGTMNCEDGGLPDVDYVTEVDHNGVSGSFVFTGGGEDGSAVLQLSFVPYIIPGLRSTCFVGEGDPSRPQGADGQPCTGDDPAAQSAAAVTLTFTTGTATARVTAIDGSERSLERSLHGNRIDCTLLRQGRLDAWNGAILVSAAPRLAVPGLGDEVLTHEIRCQPLSGGASTPTCTPPATATPTVKPSSPIAPTATPTATPPATATDSPSPVATETPGGAACSGDCDQGGTVTVDEILRGVSMALGTLPANDCPPFDRSGDGQVTVEEIIAAVTAALTGCGS